MALLSGCLLLAVVHDRNHVRTSLAWVASKLPLIIDGQTAEQWAASLRQFQIPPPCGAAEPGCVTAPLVAQRKSVQAAATITGWFDTKPDAKAKSQPAVAWNLEDRDLERPVTSRGGFSISGTNVSDQAMENVQAVLKPDSAHAQLELTLDVEGHPSASATTVPAGARFSLVTESPDDDGSGVAGAILSLRYVQAGKRKSSILYLTPAMLSRVANP